MPRVRWESNNTRCGNLISKVKIGRIKSLRIRTLHLEGQLVTGENCTLCNTQHVALVLLWAEVKYIWNRVQVIDCPIAGQ